jgi:ABC-type uncharacterized transport system involved in gliding motility auxiliary subunit
MFNRKALTGSTLVLLAIGFVAIVMVSNMLFRGARVDLTQGHLYTLSDGTKNIIGSLDEPIHLTLYYSDKATQNIPQLRTYYQRVRELLTEMTARSKGKIVFQVIDPLPFSEDEDRAAAAGLQAVPVGQASDKVFFGLVGANSTNGEANIPFFQPDKEAFLEYDVAKLIHGLTVTKKPAIGFMSELPMAMGFDQATRQMREPWAAYQEMSQQFEVRTLNANSVKAIDKDINALVVVHPKQMNEDAQYAIDQFVLRGGHLIVFVDPNAELDDSGADPNNPQAAMFANKSSDLPKLFKAWGVDYDPNKVVLDRSHALQVGAQPGAPPVRHAAILGFTKADLNRDDVVTANLDTINVSTAGFFALAKDAQAKLVPLLQTSDQSMTVATERVKFLPDPSALLNGFKPSGEHYVIAGRLEGKFKTAFPERKEDGHLAEAKDQGEILLLGDTDMLTDRMWAQVQNFLGQKVVNAFANNGDLFLNAVDNLAGSSDLISIRGRATSQRPFTTVDALKRAAEERFRSKEADLQKELTETERKLNDLQSGKSKEQALVLSPEQKAELENFTKRKVEIHKQLREVRRQLDADIEALGSRLKFYNIVLVPLLLTVLALGFALWKRRKAA